MSLDEIVDLTAGAVVYFFFCNVSGSVFIAVDIAWPNHRAVIAMHISVS